MSWYFREPTLSEILSDSIVKALMNADGVNPIALEAMLRQIAAGDHAPIAPDPVRLLVNSLDCVPVSFLNGRKPTN
jgi:hypothetical protein